MNRRALFKLAYEAAWSKARRFFFDGLVLQPADHPFVQAELEKDYRGFGQFAVTCETCARDEQLLRGATFLSGPRASAVVYKREHVEPVIEALCKVAGDSPEDYTATYLSGELGL